MKITAQTKLTKDCFKDFSYRDSDFDNWLPKGQPAMSGEVSVKILGKAMTFLEMAQEYLGTTDIEKIKKHTLTLPMVEEMVKNNASELDTKGYANFFFVESDAFLSVSVGRVHRGGRGWRAGVLSLGDGTRWDAGDRLFLRNFGTLEHSDTPALSEAIAIVEKAGYEVTWPTLSKKLQNFASKYRCGDKPGYFEGLANVAEEHFIGKK